VLSGASHWSATVENRAILRDSLEKWRGVDHWVRGTGARANSICLAEACRISLQELWQSIPTPLIVCIFMFLLTI